MLITNLVSLEVAIPHLYKYILENSKILLNDIDKLDKYCKIRYISHIAIGAKKNLIFVALLGFIMLVSTVGTTFADGITAGEGDTRNDRSSEAANDYAGDGELSLVANHAVQADCLN